MRTSNSLNLNIKCLLIAGLVSMFALESQASRIQHELNKEGSFPAWVPDSSRIVLSHAMKFEAEDVEAQADMKYGRIIGLFSAFYMANDRKFEGVCENALSLAQCKPMVWKKAVELVADKVHLATVEALKELLFLDEYSYLPFRVSRESVSASLGLSKGAELANVLSPYVSEFNSGGYKSSLYNNHPAYAQLSPLMGRMSPDEMSLLLLGARNEMEDSKRVFRKKIARARAIFEIEWRLFASNVLLPHALFTSMQRAGERALLLSPDQAQAKVSAISLRACQNAPAQFQHSPELFSFCKFLHQPR